MPERREETTGAEVQGLNTLYSRALPARRSGTLYSAFPYPTKISPEAIAIFIAAHTNPGDTIFDGFAGSGTTGLAALLCENPTDELRQEAKRLGLNPQWGVRNAILYELGALGAFVSRTLTNPPDPRLFRKAAEEILDEGELAEGWVYGALDPHGDNGVIRYVIWSDLLLCPHCDSQVTMWDACVSRDPAQIASDFTCPECSQKAPLDTVSRLTQNVRDDLIGKRTKLRIRKPVWLYGATGKAKWSRPVTDQDLEQLQRIATQTVPHSVPLVEIPWGDLYRKGYHQGITHLHHFYTRRNLIVFGRLWERTRSYDDDVGDALRFWLLSYNASHATIMTRVVAKTEQKDLVLTSAQPGVLYVSSIPVEKNLLSGLRRKLSTITDAFATVRNRKARVDVYQRSSCRTHIPDKSIDYVFTDPPFGGNIPYAEINFVNEAWLNRYTDRAEEVIISKHQKKGLRDYQGLLTAALCELRRILKPDGKVTLVFHSASAEVWNALQAAYETSRFSVECAGLLDKTQGSFKQVTTQGAVRGDPVLLLGKRSGKTAPHRDSVWQVAEQLTRQAELASDPAEQTAQRLYSRLVAHYLSRHRQVPLDADSFYRWHSQHVPSEKIAGVRS